MDQSNQLELWRSQLEQIGGSNPLLRFEPSTFGQVDLARSHPGGMAQLVSAKGTTLSNLVRDGVAFARALSAAKRIHRKANRIENNFGTPALYVAGGLLRFGEQALPILLWRATLLPRGEDFELRLAANPEINPAVSALLAKHREGYQESDLVAVASGQSDLLPIAALTLVSQYLQSTDAEVEKILVLGNFVPDLVRLRQLQPAIKNSLAALLGEAENQSAETKEVTLVADADSVQLEVIAKAAAGSSFAVHTLPGCGYLQTVVNVLANLTLQGRRTLVVAPREQTLDELAERLSQTRLPGLVVRGNDVWADTVSAISRNEKAQDADLSAAKARLASAQQEIEKYFASVNQKDEELGVSLIECLEHLAELAGQPNPPVNAARIKPELLPTIREQSAELLDRAHEAGVFEQSADSPWFGSVFNSQAEIETALKLVRELAGEEWRLLSYQISKYLTDQNLKPTENIEQWSRQLRLLLGIRETLDRFLPSIFDRPLHEMIAATAPRGERGDLSGAQRRRFRKLAKEYVRPGSSVPNMHVALVQAQQQQDIWSEENTSHAPPAVPLGLADVQGKFELVTSTVDLLQRHLDPNPDNPLLSRMNFADLGKKLEELAQQTTLLDRYMERKPIIEKLEESGLGAFYRELAKIGPSRIAVHQELELAWWQSALEATVKRNPAILDFDAQRIGQLESEYEEAGKAAITAGVETLRFRLAKRWKDGIVKHPAGADKLRAQLRTRSMDLKQGLMAGGELWRALSPAVAISPYRIWELAGSDSYDTVIILDAASAGAAESIFALSRASQVIAFGDPRIASPENFDTVARAGQTTSSSDRPSAYELVESRFGHLSVNRSYRVGGQVLGHYLNQNFYENELVLEPAVGQLFGEHNFEHVEIKDGARAETTIEGATESMDAEVDKVVELVLSHARWHPEQSLVVVTASASHAERIETKVARSVAEQASLAEFFDSHGREKFECITMSELAHRISDRVIFSLGFGRTPEGRISGTLGDFNSENAGRWMVNLIASARRRLTVVSCYNFEDFAGGSLPENQRWLKDLIAPSFLSDMQDGKPDPLLADLARRLEKHGFKVALNFASRLGLVAAMGKRAVAIDADWSLRGSNWDERLRLRPGFLKAMGWQYHRVHAFEIFARPQEVANRIAMSLGVDLRSKVEPLFDEPASDDRPEVWGDSDDSNDDRLRDDKPPHWG